MTIVGTTDSPAPITMTPSSTEDEVKFIVDEANRYLSRKVRSRQVSGERLAVLAGVGERTVCQELMPVVQARWPIGGWTLRASCKCDPAARPFLRPHVCPTTAAPHCRSKNSTARSPLPLPPRAQIKPSDVKAAWSGIRPLVRDPSKPMSDKGTAQISREVRVRGAFGPSLCEGYVAHNLYCVVARACDFSFRARRATAH